MKSAAIAARSAVLPKTPNELIEQFVTGPMTGEAVNAASLAFKKANLLSSDRSVGFDVVGLMVAGRPTGLYSSMPTSIAPAITRVLV